MYFLVVSLLYFCLHVILKIIRISGVGATFVFWPVTIFNSILEI
jgi:hypothetical protein